MVFLSNPRAAGRAFELHAARGLAEQAEDRKRRLPAILDSLVRAHRDLLELGCDRAFMSDALDGLRDEISNIEGQCDRDMDEAGLGGDGPVDYADLDALRAKVA